MWFLLKFSLAFFCTNHLLIRFCCFELYSLKIHSNDFFVHFVVRAKNLNCTLLHLFYVEPMLGYDTYFVVVIFITDFLHQCWIFEARCFVDNFNKWKFTDVTFWCEFFWWDIWCFKNFCRFDFSNNKIFNSGFLSGYSAILICDRFYGILRSTISLSKLLLKWLL